MFATIIEIKMGALPTKLGENFYKQTLIFGANNI